MSRYIDADALKENCYKQMDKLMESTSEHLSAEALSLLCGFTLIDSAPSIDIVRCKECKYWSKYRTDGNQSYCEILCGYCDGDKFCAWGERKDDDD